MALLDTQTNEHTRVYLFLERLKVTANVNTRAGLKMLNEQLDAGLSRNNVTIMQIRGSEVSLSLCEVIVGEFAELTKLEDFH